MFSLYERTGNYASSYDKKIKPQNSVATSSEEWGGWWRGVQDWELMYTRGGVNQCMAKPIQYYKVKNNNNK